MQFEYFHNCRTAVLTRMPRATFKHDTQHVLTLHYVLSSDDDGQRDTHDRAV